MEQPLPSQSCTALFARRHSLNFFAESSPILCLQLGIFDALLAPILMEPAYMILALLEEYDLVADALRDENTPSMLLDDALFILQDS